MTNQELEALIAQAHSELDARKAKAIADAAAKEAAAVKEAAAAAKEAADENMAFMSEFTPIMDNEEDDAVAVVTEKARVDAIAVAAEKARVDVAKKFHDAAKRVKVDAENLRVALINVKQIPEILADLEYQLEQVEESDDYGYDKLKGDIEYYTNELCSLNRIIARS